MISKINLRFLALIVFISAFHSCSDDKFLEEDLTTNNVVEDDLTFDYNTLSDSDKIKVIVGEAVSNYLQNNSNFNDKLFSELITPENKTRELLYIKEKDNEFVNGKTLEDLLIEFYSEDESKRQLITEINDKLPNLTIKIAEWTEAVLGNPTLDLEFAVYPCIVNYKKRGIYYRNGQMSVAKNSNTTSNVVSDYLPIQVEESERLIPVNRTSTTTIWGDDFYENYFPFLSTCSDFNIQTYNVHSNEIYDFIDIITLNEDLMNANLCAIQLPSNPNPVNCNIVYERDCRTEKNVIEGFKLANLAVFTGVNNQPGGEDVMSIHYDFTVASMCGDLMQTEICPPSDWSFVFFGTFFDYFELQIHQGSPNQSEMPDVYFVGNGYYLKAFPLYYDIPVDFSAEGIYSQARFLPLAQNGTWDGNIYGSAISFSIHEHDDIIVGQSNTYSVSLTNTTKVSSKLSLGEQFEVGGDFSNSITRSSETTITLNAAEDVELGKTATNYYEQNFTNSNIGFGYNITTGSVNTHFAFYYD